MFAHAQPGFPGCIRLESHWREAGATVRTVTEWLIFRTAAGTPVVFSIGVEFNGGGFIIGDDGVCHGLLLV